MGKPWHGKGKGSHGHSDHGGLGMLHGIARRYQEQQQLSMLGPMLASAGFGQPQGPLPPTFSCPQPLVAPMMHPPNAAHASESALVLSATFGLLAAPGASPTPRALHLRRESSEHGQQ